MLCTTFFKNERNLWDNLIYNTINLWLDLSDN